MKPADVTSVNTSQRRAMFVRGPSRGEVVEVSNVDQLKSEGLVSTASGDFKVVGLSEIAPYVG